LLLLLLQQRRLQRWLQLRLQQQLHEPLLLTLWGEKGRLRPSLFFSSFYGQAEEKVNILRAYPKIRGMPIVRKIFCQTRRFSAYRAVVCQTGPVRQTGSVRQGKATQYDGKFAVQAVCT